MVFNKLLLASWLVHELTSLWLDWPSSLFGSEMSSEHFQQALENSLSDSGIADGICIHVFGLTRQNTGSNTPCMPSCCPAWSRLLSLDRRCRGTVMREAGWYTVVGEQSGWQSAVISHLVAYLHNSCWWCVQTFFKLKTRPPCIFNAPLLHLIDARLYFGVNTILHPWLHLQLATKRCLSHGPFIWHLIILVISNPI